MASITLAGNFNVRADAPIDTRFVVSSKADLAGLLTYEGLEAWVVSEKVKYRFTNGAWVAISYSTRKLVWNEEYGESMGDLSDEDYKKLKAEIEELKKPDWVDYF